MHTCLTEAARLVAGFHQSVTHHSTTQVKTEFLRKKRTQALRHSFRHPRISAAVTERAQRTLAALAVKNKNASYFLAECMWRACGAVRTDFFMQELRKALRCVALPIAGNQQ